jgi:hypothetical protein
MAACMTIKYYTQNRTLCSKRYIIAKLINKYVKYIILFNDFREEKSVYECGRSLIIFRSFFVIC